MYKLKKYIQTPSLVIKVGVRKFIESLNIVYSNIHYYASMMTQSGEQREVIRARYIDMRYRHIGHMGKYAVDFMGKKIKTPWLPMLRVQLRSFFVLGEYDFDLPTSPRIIDAGGNIGIGSIYFWERYKPSALYVIEADQNIFDNYLRRNLDEFNVKARLINRGLWSSSGKSVNFECTGMDNGAIIQDRLSNSVATVETIALDDLLVEIKSCDLLKIDIEGAEFEVLLNSKELDRVSNIYVEVEYQRGSSKPYCKLIEFLERKGFEVYQESQLKYKRPADTYV